MTPRLRNELRVRAVLMARTVKQLFEGDDAKRAPIGRAIARVLIAIARPSWVLAWAYRAVFTNDGRIVHRTGQIVLADLRDYAFATKSTFDPDPYIAARRAGRRDVWLRLSHYLNLDEAQVQTLMEIDDG